MHSVSYTHLDVYKRQRLACTKFVSKGIFKLVPNEVFQIIKTCKTSSNYFIILNDAIRKRNLKYFIIPAK